MRPGNAGAFADRVGSGVRAPWPTIRRPPAWGPVTGAALPHRFRWARRVSRSLVYIAVPGLGFDVAISGLTLTGGHPIGSHPRMRSTAPPRRTNGHRIVAALVCSTLRLTFFRAARGQLFYARSRARLNLRCIVVPPWPACVTRRRGCATRGGDDHGRPDLMAAAHPCGPTDRPTRGNEPSSAGEASPRNPRRLLRNRPKGERQRTPKHFPVSPSARAGITPGR